MHVWKDTKCVPIHHHHALKRKEDTTSVYHKFTLSCTHIASSCVTGIQNPQTTPSLTLLLSTLEGTGPVLAVARCLCSWPRFPLLISVALARCGAITISTISTTGRRDVAAT